MPWKNPCNRTNVGREQAADGAFFTLGVVRTESVDGNAAESSRYEAGHADAVRVAESRARYVFEFFNRERCRESAAFVGVGHRVEDGVGSEVIGFAVDALVPRTVERTDLEAAELDEGFVNVEASVRAVSVGFESDVARQRAVFGVVLGFDRDESHRAGVPRGVVEVANREDISVVVDVHLETNEAADLEAGFGTRDVEVAGAECVANANVFHRLGLGSNDSVGGLCAGNCCESGSGADEKALDVHF